MTTKFPIIHHSYSLGVIKHDTHRAWKHTCFSRVDDCVDRHEEENPSDKRLPGRRGEETGINQNTSGGIQWEHSTPKYFTTTWSYSFQNHLFENPNINLKTFHQCFSWKLRIYPVSPNANHILSSYVRCQCHSHGHSWTVWMMVCRTEQNKFEMLNLNDRRRKTVITEVGGKQEVSPTWTSLPLVPRVRSALTFERTDVPIMNLHYKVRYSGVSSNFKSHIWRKIEKSFGFFTSTATSWPCWLGSERTHQNCVEHPLHLWKELQRS